MAQTIWIRERVFVPEQDVDATRLKKHYSKRLYVESACRPCENLPNRHNYLCDECPSYKGKLVLFSKRLIKGQEYIGLPIGDKRNIERKLGVSYDDYRIKDVRKQNEFDVKFKFLVDLRAHQIALADDFMEHQYGLIEAPPRTGKTLLALNLIWKLGQRALVLADQHEFLTQFADHIHGNVKEGIPKCTNLPELEKKLGRKLYGFPKTKEDFENFQIMLMTYQSLAEIERQGESKSKWRRDMVHANIGTVAVDEVHRASAFHFSKVISSIPARYRFGVTGTVDRKDGLELVIKAVLGPIVAQTQIEAMTPTVILHETGITARHPYKLWHYAIAFLANNKKRNAMIVKQVVIDLKNGRNILIPVMFKKHAVELVRLINKAYGKNIARTFMGGGTTKNKDERKEILTAAKSGKVRVVVGIRKMVQLGLNVPSWDTIYTVMPIANTPNLKQETSRIRTPKEGKQTPIIRLFFESGHGPSFGCAKRCVADFFNFGYNFHKNSLELAKEIKAAPRRGEAKNTDEYDEKPENLFESRRKRPAAKHQKLGGL